MGTDSRGRLLSAGNGGHTPSRETAMIQSAGLTALMTSTPGNDRTAATVYPPPDRLLDRSLSIRHCHNPGRCARKAPGIGLGLHVVGGDRLEPRREDDEMLARRASRIDEGCRGAPIVPEWRAVPVGNMGRGGHDDQRERHRAQQRGPARLRAKAPQRAAAGTATTIRYRSRNNGVAAEECAIASWAAATPPAITLVAILPARTRNGLDVSMANPVMVSTRNTTLHPEPVHRPRKRSIVSGGIRSCAPLTLRANAPCRECDRATITAA